ncbi:MAG: glycosyltransferase family 4 protein [Acidobacteriota bacterium]
MAFHIGVDATCWQNRRGYGRHARSLLRALVAIDHDNHYTLVLDDEAPEERLPENVTIRSVATSLPTAVAASAEGHRSLRNLWRMSRALSDPQFDLIFFPAVYSYVPVFARARKLVMIHDAIAETYPRLTTPRRLARAFWKMKVRAGRFQADALLTVSEYSRRELIKCLRVPADRVHVVGEASDPVFQRLPDPAPTPRLAALGIKLDQPIVVFVGGFSPHKNLPVLLDAVSNLALRQGFPGLQLIMVGDYQNEVFYSHFQELREHARKLGIQDHVMFTGYLHDDDVVVLLNLATVLVLPSLMEGFGLPAFEAAACGCPVIATKASPVPDLLGDGGRYVDPTDAIALESTLKLVIESPELRTKMSAAALAASARLTWDAAARQLLDIMQMLVGTPLGARPVRLPDPEADPLVETIQLGAGRPPALPGKGNPSQ